jgi:hypothetical protein
MDAALINPTGRKFPSMTTQDLKVAVVDYQMGLNPNAKYMTEAQIAEKIAAMVEEVRRREAGLSKTLHEVLGR